MVEPRIERVLNLQFQGDWGMANFHRVCGWLSQELGSHSRRGSRFAVQNGTGGSDALLRVHQREVDIAVTTPAYFATMAAAGVGPYEGSPIDDLRGLAVIPQRDRLAFAIDPKYGVASLKEIREARLPLRIAVCNEEAGNLIGFSTQRLLDAAGLSRKTIEGWGGSFVETDRPEQALMHALNDASIDAVVQEAIMTPWWRDVLTKRGFALISIDDDVLELLGSRFGWRPATIAAGYFDTIPSAVTALEFSDFLVFTHADLPDDVARLAAWTLTETRGLFERQYAHIPVDRSPVTYPLDPRAMAKTPVPLHPGALAHYRDAGYLS
jgi:TRAP-type uncharacterized transport system substrate-binding protein